jgi:CubicO group peptidase (beta-lactamase class C family)
MARFIRGLAAAVFVSLIAGGCAIDSSTGAVENTRQATSVTDSLVADSLVKEIRKRHAIPAMAAVVVRSDSLVAASAAGVRRLGDTARVTIQDRFHLGSNTKAMTATLLAGLIEEGALSWDTTPVEAFPRLADSIHPAYRTVTLVDLLSHRAGIAPYTDMREYADIPDLNGSPKERRASFSRYVLQRPPAHPPDSTFGYSNAGYTVAAAVAEQIHGESFEAMMRGRLFAALNMEGGFGWPASTDTDQPWGHRSTAGDSLRPRQPRGHDTLGPLLGPAGDVAMTLPDYGRFLQLHLRGLRGEETDALPVSAIRYLHESQGPMSQEADGPAYGLGWVVLDHLGKRTSGHSGSLGTFKTRAAVQPSRDVAVAVAANAGDEADAATSELRDALLERFGAPDE